MSCEKCQDPTWPKSKDPRCGPICTRCRKAATALAHYHRTKSPEEMARRRAYSAAWRAMKRCPATGGAHQDILQEDGTLVCQNCQRIKV